MKQHKKALVAYFSAGGVTRELATSISSLIEGDVYQIMPLVPYTKADLDWTNSKSRSSIEMKQGESRPEIGGRVDAMDNYDVIFVGFPIWWYRAPTIINSFLEGYDLSGKTIVPFCTSGGSDVGRTCELLMPSCPHSDLRACKRFRGNAAKGELLQWIDSLSL